MFNQEHASYTPVRWGMIGGGKGSEIGFAHRDAATRDGLFDFVAGALDIDPDRCKEFGTKIGLRPERCYANFEEMFKKEAARQDGIQAVSIATPNATHFKIAKAALEAGLHVICEKPLTINTSDALLLKALSVKQNRLFAVMYGYSGFPMIHQAREMVANGDIGKVRIVNMQFAHGFHSAPIESQCPGASWRMNPAISGPSFIIADCGTHPFYLGSFIAGLKVDSLLCTRQSFVESRFPLEDNANVLFKFKGGAVGTLWASAVNAGSMHKQIIRVIGEKGSIEWWDEYPNQLRYELQGEPVQILERGMGYLHSSNLGVAANRIGAGHAEGFFESWANLYHRYALVIHAHQNKDAETLNAIWYPDVDAGIDGVKLVDACVKSSELGSVWVDF